jgi:hypothetical protein
MQVEVDFFGAVAPLLEKNRTLRLDPRQQVSEGLFL